MPRVNLTDDDCRILRRILSTTILSTGVALKKADDNRKTRALLEDLADYSRLREKFWDLELPKEPF